MYNIRMGQPEMEEFWNNLKKKVRKKTANKTETKLFHKIGKTLKHISENPRYPGSLLLSRILMINQMHTKRLLYQKWKNQMRINKNEVLAKGHSCVPLVFMRIFTIVKHMRHLDN